MYTAIYKCWDNIDNFKIRIKSKEIPSTALFYHENIKNSDNFTEIVIPWQKKVFTEQQISKYKDLKNLKTDLEKKYNEKIQKGDFLSHKCIFTYTAEDEPSEEEKIDVKERKFNFFKKFISNFYKSDDLLVEKPPSCTRKYTKMRIMVKLDQEEGNDETSDSQTEYELCSLKWDPENNILIVHPDFSKNKKEPYRLEINRDLRNVFCYWIENESELLSEAERCKKYQLTLDLQKRKKQLNKVDDIKEIEFDRPETNEMYYHIFFEICSARLFDCDNLFVQYCIDLPENWRIHDNSASQLFGVTHCAQVRTLDNYETSAMIGFPFEITLIYDLKKNDLSALSCPTIYFEIISKDTWSRYRTEGYTYKMIPVYQPGVQTSTLQCLRVKPESELRHFFIGGCAILDDITWLDIPTNYKHEPVINKFGITTEGTGVLDVKIQIVQQSQPFAREDSDKSHKTDLIYASSLVKSINEVLLAFKKARDNMNSARKKLQ